MSTGAGRRSPARRRRRAIASRPNRDCVILIDAVCTKSTRAAAAAPGFRSWRAQSSAGARSRWWSRSRRSPRNRAKASRREVFPEARKYPCEDPGVISEVTPWIAARPPSSLWLPTRSPVACASSRAPSATRRSTSCSTSTSSTGASRSGRPATTRSGRIACRRSTCARVRPAAASGRCGCCAGSPRSKAALRDGRLCISTVTLLGPLLTHENLDDLVARAAYRTKAEVEHLVASLQPRAAPRDGIRKLPERAETLGADATDSPRGGLRLVAAASSRHAPAIAPPDHADELVASERRVSVQTAAPSRPSRAGQPPRYGPSRATSGRSA